MTALTNPQMLINHLEKQKIKIQKIINRNKNKSPESDLLVKHWTKELERLDKQTMDLKEYKTFAPPTSA